MEKWWETRMLTLEMLEIDKRYQRSLDLAWVKDIAKNFDPFPHLKAANIPLYVT